MTYGQVRRITWRTADVVRLFALAALFLFLWRFFWLTYSALLLAMISVLIAIVLHVPARSLSRWIPFRLAFALVLVTFLGGIALLLVKLIPQLVEQATLLATQLPQTLENAEEWYRARTGAAPDRELAQRINEQAAEFAGRFIPVAFNAVTTLIGSLALVALAVFLGAQPQMYRALLLDVVPPEARGRWERMYDEAGANLKAWVIGKAITMLAVGVAVWVGLTLFGLPGALALAALAAFMEFVPNIGPTLAAIPAIITAFGVSPLTALYVAGFYFVLQQVQNAITVPLVERRAVNIPPAVLLTWQLMLAVGFGILGLFVATPLLAVLVVAVRVLYLEPSRERSEWDRRESAGPEPAAPPERES